MRQPENFFLSRTKYNSLKSKYLEKDYKNDLLDVDNIEIVDKNTLKILLKVKKSTLDKEGRFHLSSITALVFSSQFAILNMLLDLNKSDNDIEFYTTECHLKMLKVITSKTISLETKIVSSEVKSGYKFYNLSANFENSSFMFTAVGVVKI